MTPIEQFKKLSNDNQHNYRAVRTVNYAKFLYEILKNDPNSLTLDNFQTCLLIISDQDFNDGYENCLENQEYSL